MINKLSLLVLLLSLQPAFAESLTLSSLRKNIHKRDHLKFRAQAKQTYYSKFDNHNNLRNADSDFEFEVAGIEILLKGYSQERARADFYEEAL